MKKQVGDSGYIAFSHDGRKTEIYAKGSYSAYEKAVEFFKAPKSKKHLAHVHLAERSDGSQVSM